jgi:mono/diheme cytochrome c family protein
MHGSSLYIMIAIFSDNTLRWTMRIVASTLFLTIVFGTSHPILAQNAANGMRLSERWCTSCHLVSPRQSTALDGTPSFESIASREGFSTDKLALFLLVPHPIMPSMSLSRDEAADIAAYIAQQKKPGAEP